jgi:hypothetical protein
MLAEKAVLYVPAQRLRGSQPVLTLLLQQFVSGLAVERSREARLARQLESD